MFKITELSFNKTIPLPSAVRHEGLCGYRLGHPSGAAAEEGHHGPRPGHRRRNPAVQSIRKAGL